MKYPAEIKKLRIADIACGSGIFLTEVLDYLINYCQNWYEKNKKYDNLEETYTNTYKLTYREKREILSKKGFFVVVGFCVVEPRPSPVTHPTLHFGLKKCQIKKVFPT